MDAFNPQRDGVQAIEEMMLGSAPHHGGSGVVGRNGEICLSRRTFTKVRTCPSLR